MIARASGGPAAGSRVAAHVETWAARIRSVAFGAAEDRWSLVLGLLVAAFALGQSLKLGFVFQRLPVLWLGLAVAAATVAIALPHRPSLESLSRRVTLPLLAAFVGLQLVQLIVFPPARFLPESYREQFVPFYAGVAVAAGLVAMALIGPHVVRRGALVALIATHFVIGGWFLVYGPHPVVDLGIMHRDSVHALLAGANPYALTFPLVYTNPEALYGPGMWADGRVTFGFPYPPLSLLLAAPGELVAGDYRWAMLVAVDVTAALIAFTRPGPLATGAAALFLFTPRGFYVLQYGWTEPLAAAVLAAVVFVAVRRPRFLALALGAFIALKQYLLLAVLAVPLLARDRGHAVRTLGVAAATAAVLTVPFALLDLAAFTRALVTVQLTSPFRPDSISFPALWVALGGEPPTRWLPFVAIVPAALLTFARMPRTPSGFAAAVGLLCLVFFAFGKQAFVNYYFFVLAAFAVAAGAAALPVRDGATADSEPAALRPTQRAAAPGGAAAEFRGVRT